jgi:hypothetical protein
LNAWLESVVIVLIALDRRDRMQACYAIAVISKSGWGRWRVNPLHRRMSQAISVSTRDSTIEINRLLPSGT